MPARRHGQRKQRRVQAIDRAILTDTARRLMRNNRIRRRTGLYPLDNLYLFITMRCNAKCDHCFCWQDLNIGIPELTLEQVTRLAETVPRHRCLVLTGGEPSLRRDLLDVLCAFAERDKVELLRVNTNALMPERLVELAHEFKRRHPHTGLDFQLSLDGLEETHDRIRGVPGNFRKVIETARKLWPLRAQYPSLAVSFLTVVTNLNYKELVALNDHLREHVGPDVYQGFEVMRDVNRTAWNVPEEIREANVAPKNMDLPPVEDFELIAEALETIRRRSPWHVDAFRLHNLAQLEMIRTGREQYPCVVAGSAVGVIYCNGDVAHCEFTKPFANLAEFGFDFDALWHSDAANHRRTQIRQCHCTHGCYLGKSVEYSWKGLGRMLRQAV